MTASNILLDAALSYASRGWPVLPCSPVHKRPMLAADKDADGKAIKGSGGVRKASTDADQIRGWWKRWPTAMIGLAMGHNGLFALDFDPRTDGATGEVWTLDRLKTELEDQIAGPLPVSLAVRTPSDGVHVYLKQPAGTPITNRGNLPDHVDVRGEGGYVIAPPSVMATGRGYRWVRYVDKMGWMAYDGRRFILDGADALIGGWVHETVRAMRAEARVMRDSGRRDQGQDGALDDLVETKRDGTEVLLSDKLVSWAKASESSNRLSCIAGIARNLGTAGLTIQPEQLDRNPFLINVLNGTLELHHEPDAPDEPWAELRLRPHDPADLITRLAPTEYRPGAVCPVYDRFLARVQPADDMRRFLHQWGGLSLTGDVSEQKLAFFHGKGANGKSTLVDTWATISGDYSGTVPIETFLDQGRKRKGSDASPDLAALVGVRMLRTSEPEKGSKLAEALIKLATGGEPIPVRRLMRDPFDLYPAFKLTVSGNHRPSISGIDDGIWRRVMLVPWDVQIPDSEKDRNLVAKMKREASGILNRLLEGLVDWRLNGLQEPASVRGATADYREESDPLGRFLALCTAETKGERVQSSKLYALFIAWARASGEREWTQTGFSKAMLDRGHRKVESHGMRWVDLSMTKDAADFDEPVAGSRDDWQPRTPSEADDGDPL